MSLGSHYKSMLGSDLLIFLTVIYSQRIPSTLAMLQPELRITYPAIVF